MANQQENVLIGETLYGGVEGDRHIYKMNASVRGYCAMFLNQTFTNELGQVIDFREGSIQDMNMLRHVFQQCHFEIYDDGIILDTPSTDIIDKIKNILDNSIELETHDAFVGVFSSHGHESVLFGSDCKETPIQDIIELFNNKNCPSLRGKPKIFIFLCCRGEQMPESLSGVRSTRRKINRVNVDQEDDEEIITLPLYEDIIICYSTVLGSILLSLSNHDNFKNSIEYISLRDGKSGTIFGQILAKNIINLAKDRDLEFILRVCAQDMSEPEFNCSNVNIKLMSSWRAIGWRKMLYFNPGHQH